MIIVLLYTSPFHNVVILIVSTKRMSEYLGLTPSLSLSVGSKSWLGNTKGVLKI